jgi:hypothetical protein
LLYWLPIVVVLVVSVGVSFSREFFPFGWFGCATAILAAYHGFMYQNRLSQRVMEGEQIERVTDLGLCAGSLLLGALSTVAGSIAFFATCIPAGVASMSVIPGQYGPPPGVFTIISVLCGVLSLFCVHRIIRVFVPRKPSS